ncbi:MAG TPA: 2-succinyl-5-enolpyruvyl-6-hydroxy-3-cyclohexene-1-carboxylic-acid synthase [Ignavibacteriales bacterium]|nr:2-succinyl-5-enolpyruvyl-6-hydroxy-3-cyclohexene-1-carboxylic-acid synthase [Ignavibacteriales bacterium]
MKIKVNRNSLWSEIFVKELADNGVKYACISPGSRNTPLTLAFSTNKDIQTHILVDERSNGFFALGLARASKTPVALVCTSGTAVAEFYPAIIEAFQQNVPLIVCTADRPPELQDCGANQTIHQNNIYKNHICWFTNAGLPGVTKKKLEHIKTLAKRAFNESNGIGPVHVNFPFRKPLEPFVFTDEIDEEVLRNLSLKPYEKDRKASPDENLLDTIYGKMKKTGRCIILSGPDEPQENFACSLQHLASIFNVPILADGASQLRYGGHDKDNVFVNFEGFLRSKEFSEKIEPELILHFGRTMTSKGMEIFLEKTSSDYYLINERGTLFDPFGKARGVLPMEAEGFLSEIIRRAEAENFRRRDSEYLDLFRRAEQKAEELKGELILQASFPFEGRIFTETLSMMPHNSNLMISNSMPVRDLDYFSPKLGASVTVFNNRGASGIDGITSTALGLSRASGKPTVMITGDLAFYYDLNGLLASKKYSIPLVVVLINNDGGGIFEMLPVASCKEELFRDCFQTPHELDFSYFVQGYGGEFLDIKSWEEFRSAFSRALNHTGLSVLHLKTDSKTSTSLRRRYWDEVGRSLL